MIENRLRAALLAAVTFCLPGLAPAADVGVSVSVGQPGFYGRIDIGNYPQPQFIYEQPRIIAPMPYGAVGRPVYLRVPPGHAKDWAKHCSKYAACNQPVYFVQDRWYQDVYVPHYQQGKGKGGKGNSGYGGDGKGHGNDKGHGKDKGHGNGGKGNGKGKND